MSLSPIEVINEFNIIKDKYRTLYFDIYTVLIECDWEPLDDYISNDNYDFLVTSDLYDRYMGNEEATYEEVIDLNNIQSFEVEVFNYKTIKPPKNFVCSIKDFSNIVIEDLLKDYDLNRINYHSEIDDLFKSNNWFELCIEDVEINNGEDTTDFKLYVNPFIMFNVDEYNQINKDNIYDLLNHYSNLIVYSDLWYGFEIT